MFIMSGQTSLYKMRSDSCTFTQTSYKMRSDSCTFTLIPRSECEFSKNPSGKLDCQIENNSGDRMQMKLVRTKKKTNRKRRKTQTSAVESGRLSASHWTGLATVAGACRMIIETDSDVCNV